MKKVYSEAEYRELLEAAIAAMTSALTAVGDIPPWRSETFQRPDDASHEVWQAVYEGRASLRRMKAKLG